jgi:hypothetical protein
MRSTARARAPYAIPWPPRALGELDTPAEMRWVCCETHDDGSKWEMNVDTYEQRMVQGPPPPPPKATYAKVPVLVGTDPVRGYVWQMPNGTFVTTPTEQPPGTVAPAPAGAIVTPTPAGSIAIEPLDVFFPAPVTEGQYQAMPAAPERAWEAQTAVALPGAYAMAPATSPGMLPASGEVVAPNFSDPAGVVSPFSPTATQVITGPAPGASVPASSEPSMLPWLVAAAIGFFALRG